jgi:HSP20 family protein
LIQKDDAFHLESETPGIIQKGVSIDLHNDILTLKGDREQSSQSDKNDCRICEFRKQIFVRSFRINDQINSEKVVAKMGQGILKVTLPKKEQTKPKKIKIEVES